MIQKWKKIQIKRIYALKKERVQRRERRKKSFLFFYKKIKNITGKNLKGEPWGGWEYKKNREMKS